MNKKISLTSLVILIIASIDNIKNLPAAALFGSSIVFFFILSALLFLIPTALVAAKLSAAFPNQGGVYSWVNQAFGKKWAMLSIWLQWINTMIWFPTMLSFVAGTLAYAINPELAESKSYLITCILVIFWGLTLVNLKGVRTSAILNNILASIGTIIPLILLIILGGIWYFTGQPLQVEMTRENIIPPLADSTSWVSLIAIMASFLGVELSGVHVRDVKNPKKNFPKALLIASIFIFLSMMLGTLAIAFVVPKEDINFVTGVMQLIDFFFGVFGLKPLVPIFTLLIAIGSIGTMINWLVAPAKGLLNAAEFGFLPPFFSKTNSSGVPSRILFTQAIIVSLVCSIFLFIPEINAFYWFLTALSTELYMIMYILMFGAFITLTRKKSLTNLGMWTTALLGFLGCSITIVVTFFAPENIDVGSPIYYLSLIGTANILAISPVFLFFLYASRSKLQQI